MLKGTFHIQQNILKAAEQNPCEKEKDGRGRLGKSLVALL